MPFVLPLSNALKQAGWKVKIHDSERLEPPHVTIYRKRRTWRLSLRDGNFLEADDKWSHVAQEVREAIEAEWEALCAEWDMIHPENPVSNPPNE
jgi:hypothetical protein